MSRAASAANDTAPPPPPRRPLASQMAGVMLLFYDGTPAARASKGQFLEAAIGEDTQRDDATLYSVPASHLFDWARSVKTPQPKRWHV